LQSSVEEPLDHHFGGFSACAVEDDGHERATLLAVIASHRVLVEPR